METLLRYEHVDIAYLGQPAVEDVSFSLSSGEILGIVGESGSGKSTLIKAAMGLLGSEGRVTGGSIRYKGRDLTALPQKELRKLCGPELGYIFQSAGSAFCPIRTVGAQLYEAMREHGRISKALFEERALEMLTKLGFEDGKRILTSYPFELSGGMQQRVDSGAPPLFTTVVCWRALTFLTAPVPASAAVWRDAAAGRNSRWATARLAITAGKSRVLSRRPEILSCTTVFLTDRSTII